MFGRTGGGGGGGRGVRRRRQTVGFGPLFPATASVTIEVGRDAKAPTADLTCPGYSRGDGRLRDLRQSGVCERGGRRWVCKKKSACTFFASVDQHVLFEVCEYMDSIEEGSKPTFLRVLGRSNRLLHNRQLGCSSSVDAVSR